MNGIKLTFKRPTEASKDSFNNPVMEYQDIEVCDCLVAPVTTPQNAREQQAMDQSRDQVHIHLPKDFKGNIADSTVEYDGKTFKVDSQSVKFMDSNTPTRWNRYFRAEHIDVN